MQHVVLSRAAVADHRAITSYIAQDNQHAALRFGDELFDVCEARGHFPLAGRRRADVDENLFTFSYGNYVIIYSVETDHVLIRRIVHGARDLRAILKREADRPTA